jgi:hypothetical protein
MLELRQMSKTGNNDWRGQACGDTKRFGGAPADVAFLGFPDGDPSKQPQA